MPRVERVRYNWRTAVRGWQYKEDAPEDKKWQKDRQKLFKKNGNGWWLFTPTREES